MSRYGLICGIHNGLEILIIALLILTRASLAGPRLVLQATGFTMSALGFSLLVYAGVHLKGAAQAARSDQGEELATHGPYRWIRHPYYLGDILFIMGLSLGFRSVFGAVATFMLLIPSAIYVARVEERILHKRFGEAWERFAARTYFMFPPIY